MNDNDSKIKHLTPENLYAQLCQFTSGMAVTKGEFELIVDKCTLEDIEWNHMDQMHRLSVHNTYEKGIRIATGSNFAISLTQWKKWPILIPVQDVYIAKGLFYQSLSLAGILFVHSIVSMQPMGESVKLKHEWFIASHKLFKFLHSFFNKKMYKLTARLQEEDEPLRQGRYELRKKGYHFKTDVPDYYNSNVLGVHTIYPDLSDDASILIDGISDVPTIKKANEVEFIVKKSEKGSYLIWPATCPHEGGPLVNGKFCDLKVTCPWHGLHFKAAQLSDESPNSTVYGFEYKLLGDRIYIKKVSSSTCKSQLEVENQAVE